MFIPSCAETSLSYVTAKKTELRMGTRQTKASCDQRNRNSALGFSLEIPPK